MVPENTSLILNKYFISNAHVKEICLLYERKKTKLHYKINNLFFKKCYYLKVKYKDETEKKIKIEMKDKDLIKPWIVHYNFYLASNR
jgi:phosphoribosylformylglycinamidine (FGAM) synthase PurS component